MLDLRDWKLDPFWCMQNLITLGAPGCGSPSFSSVSQPFSPLQLEARPTSGSCGCITQHWISIVGYVVPPFALIGRCLKKVLGHQVPLSSTSDTGLASSVMVSSTNGHRDVCCPSILPSSVSRPINTSGGITSPAGRMATIRQSYSLGQEFQARRKTSWLQHGGREARLPIHLLGESGIAGVVRRKINPVMHQ